MKTNYREKIYQYYLSSGNKKQVSVSDLEKKQIVFKNYLAKHLPENKDSKILDLGCGYGSFVYFLNKLGYQNVFGIDVSQEQIDQAKALGIKNIEQKDIFQYLENKENELDLIVMLDVLEHLTKDEIMTILKRVFKSLKPKGRLIVQTLNAESPFFGRIRYGDFTHETGFTAKSLNQVLRVNGFKSIDFYPIRPIVHNFKSRIRFVLWLIVETLLNIRFLIETGGLGNILTQNLVATAEKQ